MNYYGFHVGDYRSATMHLTNEEDLAYRRVLDWYYDTEKPIPLETQWVARRLRIEVKDLETVLNDFFTRTDDGWVNERCAHEIEVYHQSAEKNRANGRKGGRPKKVNLPENEAKTNPNETQENPVGFQSVANTNPVQPTGKATRNQEPITSNTPIPPTQASGAVSPKPAAAVSLPAWLTTIKAMGEQPIPETDPVFDYADQAGIPMDMLRLCWVEFRSRYSEPNAKRYKDWRSVYRKAVRGNWLRLWRTTAEGGYVLTTEGQQAQRVLDAKHGVAA